MDNKEIKEYEKINWNGKIIKVMQEIDDPKYGMVLKAYVDDCKRYIVNDSIVTDSEIIDYLDNKYGRPTWERGVVF